MINSEESKSVPSDFELGFGGRAFAAAVAAALSAVIVNPLDVSKVTNFLFKFLQFFLLFFYYHSFLHFSN
jgi:hypothetical protein